MKKIEIMGTNLKKDRWKRKNNIREMNAKKHLIKEKQ